VLPTLAALALVVLAVGMETYQRDPAFAERIGALAQNAQAQVATLVGEIGR
jgi:hypothetical protein